MTLTPATRLGSCEGIAPLAACGVGEVHRAKDLRLRREIALKWEPCSVPGSSRTDAHAAALAALRGCG